jgi:hypothetical protein
MNTTANVEIADFTGTYKTSGARYCLIVDPNDRSIRDWSCIGQGTLSEVWHRLAVSIPVSTAAHTPALRRMVAENVALFAELMDLYKGRQWDGSNWVGDWGDWDSMHRMIELASEIESLIADVPTVWDACEYLTNTHASDLLDYGDSVADIAQELAREAKDNGAIVLTSDLHCTVIDILSDYAEELRDMRDDESDEYDTTQAADLAKIDRLLTAVV